MSMLSAPAVLTRGTGWHQSDGKAGSSRCSPTIADRHEKVDELLQGQVHTQHIQDLEGTSTLYSIGRGSLEADWLIAKMALGSIEILTFGIRGSGRQV